MIKDRVGAAGALEEAETDPWVRFELSWQPPSSREFWYPAAQGFTEEPLF
jgi:hypothetical protein